MLALVVLYALASPPRQSADGLVVEAGRVRMRARRREDPVVERNIAPGLRADKPLTLPRLTDVNGEDDGRP